MAADDPVQRTTDALTAFATAIDERDWDRLATLLAPAFPGPLRARGRDLRP